jgi:peptidoglycan/LPS O-acetylase OafA/YrhL
MSVSVPKDRYHALDSLRGFAMFLGVVLHVAISFMATPPAFWPVRDAEPTPAADVFLLAVHDFRMQLFFLLAGFFGCLLFQRYGLAGMVLHRVNRVAVPFALALVFIVPTVQAVGVYAEVENVRAGSVRGEPSSLRAFAGELVAANPDAGTTRLVADYLLSGASFERLPLLHLWFLYYLLLFVAAVALLAPPLGRLAGTPLLARADAAFRKLVEGAWRVPLLALLTLPLMLPMKWTVDTPAAWNPQWHIVGYYFAFFAFGWMLFRHRDLVPTFGREWRWYLIAANLAVLPVVVGLVVKGAEVERAGGDVSGLRLGAHAASVLYTWLMIVGLWGAFLHWFSAPSAWVRYLADSAYWCYLASLTPIIALQFAVSGWPLPGLVKGALVTVATVVVLLASYEWCVRYTFVGAILNGRKYRPREATAVRHAPRGPASHVVREQPLPAE